MNVRQSRFVGVASVVCCCAGFFAPCADAVPMVFQQGTAQLSQGGFSPDEAVDGSTTPTADGWAMNGTETDNTAVWETATDTGEATYTDLTFNLLSGGYGNHLLGSFRISVTNADRSLFANGNDNFGFASPGVGTETGVTWTPLLPTSVTGTNGGTTFSVDGSGQIVVGGTLQDPDTYTVVGSVNFGGITGVRLETLLDASLPTNGPGRAPSNGNFVLIEFTGDANAVIVPIPEPSTGLLLGLGIVVVARRRRQAKK